MQDSNSLFAIACVFLVFVSGCACRVPDNSSSAAKVRIKITTYSNLPSFTILLSQSTRLSVDGRWANASKLMIYPAKGTVSVGDRSETGFRLIGIESRDGIFLESAAGKQKFDGDFAIRPEAGSVSVIDTLDRDVYFASVLGAEMGESFADEALKAQAVAIRSYYFAKRAINGNRDFDCVNADGSDMVYRGTGFATKRMFDAFSATENTVLVRSDGSIALPLFHSTSGGYILRDEVLGAREDADVADPVLLVDRGKSGEPRASGSPFFNWECELGIEKIRAIVAGDVRFDITGVRGLRYFGDTGCVSEIGFYNADSEYWMRGFRFVSLCQRSGVDSVRSIQFSIHDTRRGILFRGRGFGHLCGMSQYSAQTMAREGAGYLEILATYYPDYTCTTKEL